MSVSKGTLIKKASANNIVGAINDFNARVIEKIQGDVTYDKGNEPTFTGTADYGRESNKGGFTPPTVGFTNPPALPPNQLNYRQSLSLKIDDKLIKANPLWTNMLLITRLLISVRGFTSNWYHREQRTRGVYRNVHFHYASEINDPTGGVRVLKDSISGIGVFNTDFPNVPSGSDTFNKKSSYWTREGEGNITINPNQPIIPQTLTTAKSFNDAVQKCYDTWYEQCYQRNRLTYNFYTCHLNCHDNCHDNRSRR